jgi:hypothetical protein
VPADGRLLIIAATWRVGLGAVTRAPWHPAQICCSAWRLPFRPRRRRARHPDILEDLLLAGLLDGLLLRIDEPKGPAGAVFGSTTGSRHTTRRPLSGWV